MSQRLQIDNTAQRIDLCEWHMRRVFNENRLWERARAGEFEYIETLCTPRDSPNVPDGKFNQEFVIRDPRTKLEIARCHRFLKADKSTVAASGLPDPKEICFEGKNYHLLGRRAKQCPWCEAGISTYVGEGAMPG